MEGSCCDNFDISPRPSSFKVFNIGFSIEIPNFGFDEGHNVKVLEASDRVGGRVQTYRDLSNGWQAELGAMRIPKTHKFTLGYANRYNLTLKKFNNAKLRYNIHERTLKPDYDLEDLNFFKNEFNVHAKDRHHKAGKMIVSFNCTLVSKACKKTVCYGSILLVKFQVLGYNIRDKNWPYFY